MRRAVIHHLRRFSAATHRSSPPPLRPTPSPPHILTPKFRSFSSSDEDAPRPSPPLDLEASGDNEEGGSSALVSGEEKLAAPVEDVGNEELKGLIEKYLHGHDEKALPSIMEAILRRRLCGKHEHTDDELMEEMRMRPLQNVTDKDFEEDFEELHSTDDEIENLYNTRPYVEKKMEANEYFNMDDRKWDEMIRHDTEQGLLKDTSECEQILEDMLSWDKLLPGEIKQKIEAKFNELEDMCKKGEMEPEKAYAVFKEFEDKMVEECEQIMAVEQEKEETKLADADKKVRIDDPPGEGPVLRWQTRVVFAPGGDAYHPKNRKVKLSVTVKELGLSRHAVRRLKELVGKRYHSGKDELTITSERFEHREENRKDCLRTLYALIEEAMNADKLAQETRSAFVKSRLRANEPFMERLRAKVASKQSPSPTSA